MCLDVCVCPLLKCFSKLFNMFVFMSIYFSSSVYLKPKLSMSKRLRAFFNSGKNPCLTYPLLLVSNSTMFNASYISSSGSKLHLKRGLESSIFCKAWGLFKFKF